MAETRYAFRREPDGTWTVYDIASGEPAKLNGQFCCGLRRGEAQEISDYLNRQANMPPK